MHHRPLSPKLKEGPPPPTFVVTSNGFSNKSMGSPIPSPISSQPNPTILGLPLKYVALVTLAVQNAALSIVMHYSRVSAVKPYSPALAVLMNELIKGSISLAIAFWRIRKSNMSHHRPLTSQGSSLSILHTEIFSKDCWKLSIPALLYVIQNTLQFVAISNLPVASFQVMYQMKILTTAAFSVAMLGKRLSGAKWLSLLFLALGVGIVQVQTTYMSRSTSSSASVGSAHDSAPLHIHRMNPVKGFSAVIAACFTSGLAGVYFERELKNSKTDLWVRNVQLSIFSLLPAILPLMWSHAGSPSAIADLFGNFGAWAWATVLAQVFGGLITAIVIKYSDNIMKGFATSLAIILSSLASVALFDFPITLPFLIGSSTVLLATWMYNQPPGKEPLSIVVNSMSRPSSPILGQFPPLQRQSSFGGKPAALASALGIANRSPDKTDNAMFGETLATSRYQSSPYGSPFASRSPSREPSRPTTPVGFTRRDSS